MEPPISECDESGLSRRLQIRKPSEASWAHVPRANFPGTCFNRKSLGALYGESFVLAVMYYEVILDADVARSVASVVPLSISGTHWKLVSQCLLVCGSFVLNSRELESDAGRAAAYLQEVDRPCLSAMWAPNCHRPGGGRGPTDRFSLTCVL
jgi:hypothetical protein